MAFVLPAIPMIAAAAGVAGAGISAYGAIQGGKATRDMMNYRAQIAQNNKTIAEQNAESTIQAGQAKAQATGMKGAAEGGRMKARQAASGVDVNTGSFVDVQEGQREAALLDVETVIHNADLRAYGYRAQAQNFEAESQLDRMAGEQAETAGKLKAASTILGAASSLGGKWTGGPVGGATNLDMMPDDV